MESLKDVLAKADRKKLIDDVVALIDAEVKAKSGMSGMALKAGYKVVKKLKGGRMIHKAADHLLDDFTEAIDGLYTSFKEGGGTGTFTDFLNSHKDEATAALLEITDRKARGSSQAVLKKTYAKLRGQAEKHVKAALPGVGRLVQKYV